MILNLAQCKLYDSYVNIPAFPPQWVWDAEIQKPLMRETVEVKLVLKAVKTA